MAKLDWTEVLCPSILSEFRV